MTSATIDESRGEPAASGVPSLGDSSQAPEGITRARADDSPRAAMLRAVGSPTRVTSNHEEKASTRSSPSGSPERARW